MPRALPGPGAIAESGIFETVTRGCAYQETLSGNGFFYVLEVLGVVTVLNPLVIGLVRRLGEK